MLQHIACLKAIASPGVKWYSFVYLGMGGWASLLVGSVTKMGLHTLSEMVEALNTCGKTAAPAVIASWSESFWLKFSSVVGRRKGRLFKFLLGRYGGCHLLDALTVVVWGVPIAHFSSGTRIHACLQCLWPLGKYTILLEGAFVSSLLFSSVVFI